ncbi:MAG: hypothetical protein HYW24_01575 [Candidatus Aenigmarchaeota archaeon]|nr:hypothetical protein [Candidatus Aenigmarchaeota archaeon]
MRIRYDWKFYSFISLLILGMMILVLGKIFLFILIVVLTLVVSLLLRFFQPLKYIGIELVTLSTFLIGIAYGPVVGGLYGFSALLLHFIIGHYYIGHYVIWVIPEYVLIGVFSGILQNQIIGFIVPIIIILNLSNLFLTFLTDPERAGKHIPYVIGNTAINSIIALQFFEQILGFIA